MSQVVMWVKWGSTYDSSYPKLCFFKKFSKLICRISIFTQFKKFPLIIYLFFGCKACEILVLWPGIKPPPLLQWNLRVLTCGPPGKSPQNMFVKLWNRAQSSWTLLSMMVWQACPALSFSLLLCVFLDYKGRLNPPSQTHERHVWVGRKTFKKRPIFAYLL